MINPMMKRKHAEALAIFLDGRVNERGAYNPPPVLASNHRANDPQVSEAPFAALFAQKL